MNFKLISKIEKFGCVDEHGHHLYGTAALLHFLNKPVSSINPSELKPAWDFIEKCLSE